MTIQKTNPKVLPRSKSIFGFTLVELIVVITILAILGTIGFIAIQGYSTKSRDSVRISSTQMISKALEVYQIEAGTYPDPENIYGTGTIGGVTVSQNGYIGERIAARIKLDKIPLDPLSKNKYVYGVDAARKQFQVATVFESSLALGVSRNILAEALVPTTYAAGGYEARVSGNYLGLVKVNTTLYNPPSLIVAGIGSTDLTATTTRFVTNKGDNLPYLIASAVQGSVTPAQSLALVGSSASTLTGITLSSWNADKNTLATSLGYSVDAVGVAYYGQAKYFNQIVVSGDATITPTTFFAGAGTSISPWTQNDGTAATTCNAYNTTATTNTNGSPRGTGVCGDGTKQCLSDGVYAIAPDGIQANKMNVYCDMTNDGGGWTLAMQAGSNWGFNYATWDAVTAVNTLSGATSLASTFKLSDSYINSIKTLAYRTNNYFGTTRYFKPTCIYGHKTAVAGDCTVSYSSLGWPELGKVVANFFVYSYGISDMRSPGSCALSNGSIITNYAYAGGKMIVSNNLGDYQYTGGFECGKTNPSGNGAWGRIWIK